MTICKLNGLCGGCRYSDIPYDEQLEMKESQLLSLLSEVKDENTVWEGIAGSPDVLSYRNKMEYSFGDEVKDGPLTLGMHKHKCFWSVLTCDECLIVPEDFNKIVKATLDYFTEKGITYHSRKTHIGYLRHLLIRRSVSDGEMLVDLITASGDDSILQGWTERLLALPLKEKISGILHTRNDSLSDAVKDEGTELLYGKDYLTENLLGLKFRISVFSFFQTNSRGAEVLYSKAREYVGDTKDKKVYDLYSGTGTIAQLVAPVADKVYGVEIVEEAVEAAKENAAANGITNAEFIAGDVLKVLDSLTEKPDIIIVDPPREGLHPKVLPKLIAYGVENIVYIACKPQSFVRDMPAFAAAGYRIVKAGAVDMFPNTPNVELISLLRKEM